ncbi:hypothetical protein UlMin_015655 [Ulmus minor]
MENLPVEVIGNILSFLGAARDVVLASATCRKWRDAFREHLQVLSFNSNDWAAYRDLTTSQLEILITQTIFQTTGLKSLYIMMDNVDEFSASTVTAWLMYTREMLRQLFYNVCTNINMNILEICGRQKLEMLLLAHNSITGVEPTFQRFPCLTSLSLNSVTISALDLSLLLTACPKIESLELVNPIIAMSDAQVIVELSSSSLKNLYIEVVSLDKFIIEAESIERLHLKDCSFDVFELIGKGTLKQFIIDEGSMIHLELTETVENLEVVDISNFAIMWKNFYQMISKSLKLRRLRLWDVIFDDEDEMVDIETIAVCFPQLTHLSLSYDLGDGILDYGLPGSSHLENVLVLELGWTIISDLFTHWVDGLLKRSPNLQKLVIHGFVSDTNSLEECQTLANFTSSIVELMREYIHVQVQFEYV